MTSISKALRKAAQDLAQDKSRPLGLLPLLKLAAREIERLEIDLQISRQSEEEAWRFYPEIESERNKLTLSLAQSDAVIAKAIGHLKDCPPPFVLARIELEKSQQNNKGKTDPLPDFDF